MEPVMNDISGSRHPYDMIYEGKQALVSCTFTIWNWKVWNKLKSLPNFTSGEGNNIQGDIGTLMVTEGFAYPLWLQYPYASKPVFSAAGMPAGYRFVAAFLMGQYGENMGTKANRLQAQFMCIRAYDKSTGIFMLSDQNMAGIPAVPPSSDNG